MIENPALLDLVGGVQVRTLMSFKGSRQRGKRQYIQGRLQHLSTFSVGGGGREDTGAYEKDTRQHVLKAGCRCLQTDGGRIKVHMLGSRAKCDETPPAFRCGGDTGTLSWRSRV